MWWSALDGAAQQHLSMIIVLYSYCLSNTTSQDLAVMSPKAYTHNCPRLLNIQLLAQFVD